MKKTVVFLAFVIFCLCFTSNEAFAQRGSKSQGEVIDVRLASPLPRNSDWGRALDRLAGEWARVTNNEVRLRILHDGIEGGESKMLSSLSANNIQAGLFLSSGLVEVCPAVMSLNVPFQIRNEAELDVVLKDVLPILESQMSKTNFAVVTWAKGGWVNVFSKEKVLTPDDLKRQKIASTPELKDMNTVFKTMGFTVVETDVVDLGPKLANNMVNAIYIVPAAIAPMGLHRNLKHMMHVPIAPVMGAIIMNRVTWNKIGPDRQKELVKVTQRIAADFDNIMPKATENAIQMMSRDGLSVNRPSSAQEEMWRTELQKAVPMLFGTSLDRTLYERITALLEKERNGR